MENFELPDDLAELESRLAGRPRLEPGATFRDRLLAAVGQELQDVGAVPGWRSSWQFAAAVAAAVVLWANFSMSVANDTNWRLAGDPESVDTKTLAAELRKLFPDMSEQEVNRQALVLQSGTRLPPQVDARVGAHFERSMLQRQANERK
jgi:hypothetical protein